MHRADGERDGQPCGAVGTSGSGNSAPRERLRTQCPRSVGIRLSKCSVVVHISDGDILRNSDQTMVAFMQSYCFSKVSQLGFDEIVDM
jgi:hypothetical protein